MVKPAWDSTVSQFCDTVLQNFATGCGKRLKAPEKCEECTHVLQRSKVRLLVPPAAHDLSSQEGADRSNTLIAFVEGSGGLGLMRLCPSAT